MAKGMQHEDPPVLSPPRGESEKPCVGATGEFAQGRDEAWRSMNLSSCRRRVVAREEVRLGEGELEAWLGEGADEAGEAKWHLRILAKRSGT